ncbi:P-loop containing nucleoside triphosphate hydrolase protein [Xylariaceae sp. FL1272]|nr:P-loop containing nucleoside triphosphate hydrolase protein [Xylariaceae sp. FL1272]
MPLLEPRRRSRAEYEDDDDDEPDPSPANSDSSKRRRQNHDDDDEDEMTDDSDNSPAPTDRRLNGHRNGHAATTNGYTPGPGEFAPGAIVRVRVDNFVTYEHAEFLPGPNLNMVIGPNGTGKSSLVCAICLGLGYHPKHLGRASHVGEFVKHGKDTALIEVELQKRPNERANHVIRVQINREDNGRKWWLNGREASHKEIQKTTRDLRIQIDNLCQFLPQDKVAEFAGLTPTRLLEETLRAAAPEEILQWQSQLRTLHKDHKEMKAQVETLSETLKGHESRQQGLQADVDRLRERQTIEQNVKDLQNARLVAEYNDKRRKHGEAKDRMKEAKKRLTELERACEPAMQAVRDKENYRDRIEPIVTHRKQALRDAEEEGVRVLRGIEVHDDNIKQALVKMEAEEKSIEPKKSALARARAEITNLQAKLKEKPPEFVAAEWNVRIREKDSARQEIEAERREIVDRFDELKARNGAKKAALQELANENEALDSQQGQKLAVLKRLKPDAAKGWEWLQEHQNDFDKEVFGPPMLNCSMTDQNYADVVQSLLHEDDFFCFVCQTTSDHKKLSNQLFTVMGLSCTIRTCGADIASFQPAVPKEQLGHLGLDGYAIDYVEGPRPVMAMLCAEKKLHNVGVALRDISNAQYEQLAASSMPGWASGKRVYAISRRREYGPNAISTATKNVYPARFWTDQPVDEAERAKINSQIHEVQAEMAALKTQGIEMRNKIQELNQQEQDVTAEVESLKHQKSELQKVQTQYATLGDRIVFQKQNLENTEKNIQGARGRIQELSAQADELYIERTQLVLEHKDLLSKIRDAHQSLLEVQIRLVEAKSDVKGLADRNKDIEQRLDKEKAEIEIARQESTRLRDEAQEAQSKLARLLDGNSELLAKLNALAADKTEEDLTSEIDVEQSKLEYVHAVDPSILRQFEKRAQEIQGLTQRNADLTKKFESLSRKIDELRQKWEPRVDALITKINDAFAYNFEQINCAGQVDIHKDEEDFEEWAIEIKVKFRQNETLQQLNQHRQSGGERAVSTIFYLMALQSMAQAPFRVVDEINQGMDPRNERMVHERMVEIACREHTSQYFLITPKLLTNLRYDERMRVLCIASGEHMPTEGRKLDFGRLVKIQKALLAGA